MELPTWTVECLAAEARVHPETVRAHIRAGRLKAYKIGRRWCMYDEDVEAYVRARPSAPEAPTTVSVSLPPPTPGPQRTASGRLVRPRTD